MRLTNLETKNSLDFPFTQNGKHFNFAIPLICKKETVYQIRMIRIAMPKSKPVNIAKNTKNVYRDEDGNVVAAPTKPGIRSMIKCQWETYLIMAVEVLILILIFPQDKWLVLVNSPKYNEVKERQVQEK